MRCLPTCCCGERGRHRVGRVLSFFSSRRRNWNSPTPLAAGECAPPPPPFGPGGGGRAHSLAERGWGSPNSDEGDIQCGALLYKVLCGGRPPILVFHPPTPSISPLLHLLLTSEPFSPGLKRKRERAQLIQFTTFLPTYLV